MNLFQQGQFKLASGSESDVKIECDALSDADWDAIASVAAKMLPPFYTAHGVPRGGLPFARAMQKYAVRESTTALICEDVVTTGRSMEEFAATVKGPKVGVVLFARGNCPGWVTPVFVMNQARNLCSTD